MKKKSAESRFGLCIENRDCDDLEKRKIYETLPDEGLVLREDFAEELRRSLAEVKANGQTSRLSDVVGRLESNE